ncbi:fibronectin type III domain-containing protein [Agrobacterium tumefaciens]|nr:fibronectin type III domain-containing protein [Agrobacterium tumefaciens]NTE18172.1 fibronectin type III domain-containing protein [Agrobacterium tumefaciens]
MRHKLKLLIIFMIPLIWACNDFIEPSIEHRNITILAPADKIETNSYQQTFWWNPMADALAYRLQVVSPDFEKVSKVLIDTLIRSEKFVYTLDPGKYQWRVRGENGSSASNYSDRFLEVFPSSLKDQILQVTSPANGIYLADQSLSLSWLRLFGAQLYRIQIDNNNFQDENKMILNATTDNLSFLHRVLEEGTYQYRIRAENTTENSKWSNVSTFRYDITGPAAVVLKMPSEKQQVPQPVKLIWDKVTDAVSYEITVYKTDQQTIYHKNYPLKLNSTEHTFNLGVAGETIAWRVRAYDQAGNAGTYSEFRTFVIQ